MRGQPNPDPYLNAQLPPLLDDTAARQRQRHFTRSRRLTGFWLGLAMGTLYFTIAQLINPLLMPGLPIYQLPPGMPWTALIAGLAGGLTGLLAAWPDGSLVGILWGSLVGTLFFDVYALANSVSDSLPLSWIGVFLLFILLPMAAMTSAVIGGFRWALNRQQAAWQDQRSRWITHGIPVLLITAAAVFGLTAQYSEEARIVITRMQELIRAGQAAQAQGLPAELDVSQVIRFKENAQGPYTLEWSRDETNRYAIPRPANTGGNESIVIARFSNGYLLVCLFPNAYASAECVSRGRLGAAPDARQPTPAASGEPGSIYGKMAAIQNSVTAEE